MAKATRSKTTGRFVRRRKAATKKTAHHGRRRKAKGALARLLGL